MYSRHVFSGGKNENLELRFPKLDLALFSNCSDSHYVIQDKTKKVIMENCHNVTLTINGKVLSNSLELINSNNLIVHVNVPVLTVTCDNVHGVALHFHTLDDFQLIAWAGTTEKKVFIGGQELSLETSEVPDLEKDQIVTQKKDDGQIVSQLTRRDRCGRITGLV